MEKQIRQVTTQPGCRRRPVSKFPDHLVSRVENLAYMGLVELYGTIPGEFFFFDFCCATQNGEAGV